MLDYFIYIIEAFIIHCKALTQLPCLFRHTLYVDNVRMYVDNVRMYVDNVRMYVDNVRMYVDNVSMYD